MSYTMEELFAFMDSERIVRVTDDEGNTYVGQCWAYNAVQNLEEYGVEEPSLEIGPGELLFASEIRKIEFHEGIENQFDER